MPTPLREQALAAFHGRLQTLGSTFASIERNPNWRFGPDQLPGVALFDGDESAEPGEVQRLLIATTVAVVISATAGTTAALMTELNRLLGAVRAAIGADPTLGLSHVWNTAYDGCSQPDVSLVEGTPPEGSLEATFVITRAEAEFDPYSA